jgi:hypothetical protein
VDGCAFDTVDHRPTGVRADLGQRLDRIDDLSIAVVGGCQVVESAVDFVSDEIFHGSLSLHVAPV